MESLLRFVQAITSISSPLAFGGLGLLFFFAFINELIKRLRVKDVTPPNVFKIIIRALNFGFLLAVLAMVLGVFGYLSAQFITPSLVQGRLQGAWDRKDYEQVIRVGSRYLSSNPKDDEVRHRVGSSLYATGRFDDGIKLYQTMLNEYPGSDSCQKERIDATTSLAAFYLEKGDYKRAIEQSRIVLNCPDLTDGALFNYLNALALSSDANVLILPSGRSFKTSYADARYQLLKFVFLLEKENGYRDSMIVPLQSAICGNPNLKSLVQMRFRSGDMHATPGTIDRFEYETTIIAKYLSRETRVQLLKLVSSSDCVQ